MNSYKKIKLSDFVYMNPGSVSIPKGDSTNAYMIWEGSVFIWKSMDGSECMRFEA